MTDLIDRTRPTDAGIAGEWTPQRADTVLAALTARPRVHRRRWRGWGVVAAACLAIALTAVAAGLTPFWHDTRRVAAALEPVARKAAEAHVLEWHDGQFLHVRSTNKQSGEYPGAGSRDEYFAPDGWVWAHIEEGRMEASRRTSYYIFPPAGGWMRPGFAATMPTDPAELDRFLRQRVTGSSSQDEAVFVAIGDMLRQEAAPPAVRAAAIGVLARNPKVTAARARDAIGREALRVDFRDPIMRPFLVASLYLDPASGLLLAEGTGPEFPGAGGTYGSVIVTREVVADLPADLAAKLGTEKVERSYDPETGTRKDAPAHPTMGDPTPVPSQTYSPTPSR